MITHALTIDLEEWFHVLNLRHLCPPREWDKLESRVKTPTLRLLDLLARRSHKATFFCLGWLAERQGELIAQIAAAGHEIASHGFCHSLLGELGPEGFFADLERASQVLKGILG